MMLKPVTLVQTCYACPSQWEGKLDDGRMFYIRYRWSEGSVEVSPTPTDDVMQAVGGELVCAFDNGDASGLGGDMDTAEMQLLTSHALDWSAILAAAPTGGET